MKRLFEFFAYNNAIPIAFGILFLGAAGAAAATPEIRDVVIGVSEVTQSIDNSRIVNIDIESYSFAVQITDVREDDDSYYVTYTLQTIDLVDSVWQDILRERELVVSKDALGGKDLGLYATGEIAEVRDAEKRRLTETQTYEREIGTSQKVVATVYNGLVGQFLSPTEATLPNYEPVIPEPEPVVATVTEESNNGDENGGGANNQPPATGADTTPPSISIIGDSVVRHPKGEPYTDLGALVTDNADGDIGYEIYVDGQKVNSVELDTSRVWAYVITYQASDAAGNISEARREVVIEEIEVTPPIEPEPEPEIPATTTPEVVIEPEPQATSTEPAPVEEVVEETETATSTPSE